MKGQTLHSAAERASGSRAAGVWGRLLMWGAGGTAFLFFTGFVLFSTHVSRLDTPPTQPQADAIIVLTGGQSRLDVAIELLNSGRGQRLLVSGVHPAAGIGDLKRITGGDASLFDCCVDIDHLALDTVGNAQESAKWMAANAYASAIVVTNNYHMPRSLLEMRRIHGTAELVPYPVVNTRLDRGEWITNPAALRVLFTEYTKYVAALARMLVQDAPAAARPPELETARS